MAVLRGRRSSATLKMEMRFRTSTHVMRDGGLSLHGWDQLRCSLLATRDDMSRTATRDDSTGVRVRPFTGW